MSFGGLLFERKYKTNCGTINIKVIDVKEEEDYGDAEAVIVFDCFDNCVIEKLLTDFEEDEYPFQSIIRIEEFDENEILVFRKENAIEFLIYNFEKETSQLGLDDFVEFIFDELFNFDDEYVAQVFKNHYNYAYAKYCYNVLGWDNNGTIEDMIENINEALYDRNGFATEDPEKDKKSIYELYIEEANEQNNNLCDYANDCLRYERTSEEVEKYIKNRWIEIINEEEFFTILAKQ